MYLLPNVTTAALEAFGAMFKTPTIDLVKLRTSCQVDPFALGGSLSLMLPELSTMNAISMLTVQFASPVNDIRTKTTGQRKLIIKSK
jgi:hypothetical protein